MKKLLNNKFIRYPAKAVQAFFRLSFRETLRLTVRKIKMLKPFDYSKITDERRKREEAAQFERNIKFSILVPLYNTPEQYLREMIDSVRNQTYKNWELCLADGSDDEHNHVKLCVEEYIKEDKRIVYKKLEKNKGISGNTNACLEMATGDYISLFDHDDILHPSALFATMQAICDHNADFVYTDEAVFVGADISKITIFHFKPDYSLDNLRANNYICHFSSFSRELLEKAGWFRREFDGSQDHDIILRLTSHAKKVFHIPKVLYFWRSHSGSVAGDIGSKLYAIQAGRNAVASDVIASGYNCTVDSSKPCPTIYRVHYELVSNPLVSIVVVNDKKDIDIKNCISSVIQKTTYKNYEIVVVVNDGADLNSAYYKELQKYENIRFIKLKDNYTLAVANNFGALNSNGEYVVFLNKHTKVITDNWLEEMLMYAQRSDVGAVGAKLYFSNKTIRRAGMILGLGKDKTVGLQYYKNTKADITSFGKRFYSQNLIAVSDECLMINKQRFIDCGSFNTEFTALLCPADLCLRLRKMGYLTVFTPYSEFYYTEERNAKNPKRKTEIDAFKKLWAKELEGGDPHYNPNFSLDFEYDINFDKVQHDCCK